MPEDGDRVQSEPGLYRKYRVEKDGEEIEDCFVLEPENDAAARMALGAYADATDDEELADDLHERLDDLNPISEMGSQYRCTMCGETFDYFSSARDHSESHHGEVDLDHVEVVSRD